MTSDLPETVSLVERTPAAPRAGTFVRSATGSDAVDTIPGERRASLDAFVVILCASLVVAFVILRLLAPMHWTGVDEAYYLGIGANILAGRGIETMFGEFASVHPPLWPLVLQGPARLLGIPPESWGDPLVVLCGGVVIGGAGWYAWRSVRIAAPLAIASMIAYPYLLDLAGSRGLDLPAAALAMTYVGLGIAAVRRGSFALGVAAGLCFATGFLIKELALPFAPVPLLAGLVRATPVASMGRAAAGILLSAAVGTSWWFAIYAGELGTVYRLGTPAWTLAPLALVVAALVLLGLVLPRLAPRTAKPLSADGARWGSRVGWAGTVAWAVLMTTYFAVAPNPLGTTFLDLSQMRASVVRSIPSHWPILAVLLPGVAVALVDRVAPRLLATREGVHAAEAGLLRPDDRHALDDLLVAAICMFPFVLLVVAVGEGPRHYMALIAFIAAIGAVGWAKLAAAIVRRLGPRLAAAAVAGMSLVLVGGAAMVMVKALPGAPSDSDVARASIVETTAAWIRENVPAGSAVVFGTGFATQTGLQLMDDYRLSQIPADQGIHGDPAAPVGLKALDGTRSDDWVTLWTERRDATAVFGYRAGPLLEVLRRAGPSIWVETGVVTDDVPAPPMFEALRRATGVEELMRWSWPGGAARTETVVYRVDPARFAFSDAIVLTTPALERIVRVMERDPAAYRQAAFALLDRAVVAAPEAASSELLSRLRTIAGR